MAKIELRSCLIESARLMCQRVEHEDDMPCSECIYNVSRLHAKFFRRLPEDVLSLPMAQVYQAILSAGVDG